MEKVITVETMRKSDAYTIANYIDSKKLMYKAGVGVFNSYDYKGNIAIVCAVIIIKRKKYFFNFIFN